MKSDILLQIRSSAYHRILSKNLCKLQFNLLFNHKIKSENLFKYSRRFQVPFIVTINYLLKFLITCFFFSNVRDKTFSYTKSVHIRVRFDDCQNCYYRSMLVVSMIFIYLKNFSSSINRIKSRYFWGHTLIELLSKNIDKFDA